MYPRWNDLDQMFGAMDLLRNRMGRVNRLFTDFDRSWGFSPGWTTANNWPRTNLYDSENHLQFMAAVPGLNKDEINIKIQGNYLEISGTRKAASPEGYAAQRLERGGETFFSRSYTLPVDINIDKVQAKLKDGILTLNLPKSEKAKMKKITIG
ncbi:MAG: Hsp20/alpha crystallin family protein [Proteobacteria bacterium]|nr:Hsp20/alpha crystallin family protein [Pseudomonadota bacterium]MBU1639909.1 Hsp20/alpha crystallin family protein [Pseudomonadota bacterium]